MKQDNAIQDRQELTTYILWQTWKARNAYLFNGGRKTEREIVQLAWQEWIEYKEEQEINAGGLTGRLRVEEQQGWTAPKAETIKINTSSFLQFEL